MNQLVLLARIAAIQPLRHTPAGLPVLELSLHHESTPEQAGHTRQISFELPAVAIGDIALLLRDQALGSLLQFTGFMAPRRKGSARLVLHIQQIRIGAPRDAAGA